jgi:glycosyltransferase involved in cell wall biosynthesis
MSCARPVILGVEGQAQRILEDAQAGICIEPENSSQLAETVSRLAQDPQLGKSLGRNGRRHILQHYTRRQTSAAYIKLLNRLLGEEKPRAAAA